MHVQRRTDAKVRGAVQMEVCMPCKPAALTKLAQIWGKWLLILQMIPERQAVAYCLGHSEENVLNNQAPDVTEF